MEVGLALLLGFALLNEEQGAAVIRFVHGNIRFPNVTSLISHWFHNHHECNKVSIITQKVNPQKAIGCCAEEEDDDESEAESADTDDEEPPEDLKYGRGA